MAIRTFAELRTDMPAGVAGSISGDDIRNIVDTMESVTTQAVSAKTASYVATVADNLLFFTMSVAATNTFTVPATAPVGWECCVMQIGTGQTGIAVGGSGFLRHRENHTKIAGQYGIVYLKVYSNAGTAPQVAFTGDTAA